MSTAADIYLALVDPTSGFSDLIVAKFASNLAGLTSTSIATDYTYVYSMFILIIGS